MSERAIHGAILGTVIGDAIGLPYEALSRRRGVRLLGKPDRHRMIFGRGMMSDDGEHACMTAAALARSPGDPDEFARQLAWQLRWWLLGVPAGVGWATLRAIVRLWLGVSPKRSGVFSAGNGPAMRCAVLGAAIDDLDTLARFVHASTLLTHKDPKAFHGALAVALAARTAASGGTLQRYVDALRSQLGEEGREAIGLVDRAIESATGGEPTVDFATAIGCERGVSGYILHTMPVVVHAWTRHRRDFQSAVASAIECGGDTDTVAACVGGIVGAEVGAEGIPQPWRERLLEWPRSTHWIERLAASLTTATAERRSVMPPRVGPLVIVRNIVFLGAVLVHVGRRALPPY
jgi:ADP-ribosyl-[dinitrogen reductase] hydrolase